MVVMVGSYLVVGGWVRRRVRRLAAAGKTYYVDRHHPRPR